jgi:HEAT repeat protein
MPEEMKLRLVGFALGLSSTTVASAQLPSAAPQPVFSRPSPTGSAPDTSLRARFGTEIGMRLAHSADPDERLRGIERLAAVHSPEALALLEGAAGAGGPGATDPGLPLDGLARSDPRALLVVVRALASWLDREDARAVLASIVTAPTQALSTHAGPSADLHADEAKGAALVLLARQQAAIALSESGNLLALDALISAARSAGPGQAPALDALAIHPPAQPLLGGAALTTPATVAMAVAIGDLRSLDSLEAATSVGDPALRAAILTALGGGADSRVLDAARAGLHDPDPRVRLAAGDALVHLGAGDGPLAIETLVADDATAADALRLAQHVQGEGVTKAAAARAAAAADAEVRALALAALGQQESALAVGALAAFIADPAVQGDAACALARSPSPAALGAIEKMAEAAPAIRRLAARAYLVRRFVRRDRSAPLDALLRTLARSDDVRDRAVGVQALVTLGERSVADALEDPEPRVRRAAALGALGRWSAPSRDAILARATVERDEITRQVLGLGLLDGDWAGTIPTIDLVERARKGGADAPLSAFVLAERDERFRTEVESMRNGRDPVLRAHVARGLGLGVARDAVGRLAQSYATEGDALVRRAIVAALSARVGEDSSAPLRLATLRLAARLDPDGVARWTASRALGSPNAAPAPNQNLSREIAWLRLIPTEGAGLPHDMTGALVERSGVALPIPFDEDGYALVAGVAPGEARLRLAPRPPPYDAESR